MMAQVPRWTTTIAPAGTPSKSVASHPEVVVVGSSSARSIAQTGAVVSIP